MLTKAELNGHLTALSRDYVNAIESAAIRYILDRFSAYLIDDYEPGEPPIELSTPETWQSYAAECSDPLEIKLYAPGGPRAGTIVYLKQAGSPVAEFFVDYTESEGTPERAAFKRMMDELLDAIDPFEVALPDGRRG